MVNYNQIKQIIKAVCTVSVTITKCELRFGATTVTTKSLSILTVGSFVLITTVGPATKQFNLTAM